MFLRSTKRKKDGKEHRYFSVVENRRLSSGKTAQRTVLYLGEVNDKQEAAWRKTLDVFDEERQCARTLSLFPEDREIPGDAVDSLQVKLSGLELRRPRAFGNCWLACDLWHQLGLDEFWQRRLPDGREAVSWEKVLELLVVNRLIDPASEFRVHRQWFLTTAMDELLGVDRILMDAVAAECHRERVLGEAVTGDEARGAKAGARETLRERAQRVGANGLGATAGEAPARKVESVDLRWLDAAQAELVCKIGGKRNRAAIR